MFIFFAYIGFDAVSTGSEESKNPGRDLPIAVTGSYDQMQELLENLEQMPRSFLITTVALSGGGETGEFTTTISGDMFVMAPAADPTALQAETAE